MLFQWPTLPEGTTENVPDWPTLTRKVEMFSSYQGFKHYSQGQWVFDQSRSPLPQGAHPMEVSANPIGACFGYTDQNTTIVQTLILTVEHPSISDTGNCSSLNPCLNGGTCIDGVDSCRCSCVAGYTGPDCEISKTC